MALFAAFKCLLCFTVLLFLMVSSAKAVTMTVSLSGSWKYNEDFGDTGVTNGWHTTGFNDSAWVNKNSNQKLESQGVSFADRAGYIWFRRKFVIPADNVGIPMQINLANWPNNGDDVWVNGMRVGGLRGYQMYENLTDRKYSVSNGLVYGGTNTIAVRLWASNHGWGPGINGLSAGTYTAVFDPYQIMARPTGGSIDSEKPIMGLGAPDQVFDMSAGVKAAQGFELVYRLSGTMLGSGTGAKNFQYFLRDARGTYGTLLKSGTVAITTGTDSIARAVISLTAANARTVYFTPRLKLSGTVRDAVTSGTIKSTGTLAIDRLSFYERDNIQLPALPDTYESTPYGTLKLVDTIDCSTSLNTEVHPYLQGGVDGDTESQVYFRSPGLPANVTVSTIGGKSARVPNWSFFAYRIGRGTLTPGKCYMLRVEYPEDQPRYCTMGIEAGDNYYDVGWKSGISPTDPYDPWPLNNASGVWKNYDIVFPMGDMTRGTGGSGSADPENGVWVYFSDPTGSFGPGYQYLYGGKGVAVATIKLYEIDPVVNAPTITLPPANVPKRTLMFDWEHQAEMIPEDVVNYAKLMGYSAVSPITGIKWSKINYGGVINGYESWSIDAMGHMVSSGTVTNPASDPATGIPSIHEQFLTATKDSGIDYIPRFEYGGSWDLPSSAYAIGPNGTQAVPNRFNAPFCANLLNESTYQDMKYYLDNFIAPYVATNPQMIGALWRIRCDRMPVSYGINDINLFCSETGAVKPGGYSNAQLARWASNTSPEGNATVAANYSTWWQGKRRDFHVRVKNLLKSYRSDLTLYYYNWDSDNFSLMGPDLNGWNFTRTWSGQSAANKLAIWNADRTARAGFTMTQYSNILSTGSFYLSGTYLGAWPGDVRPHYALRPALYTGTAAAGIQLFAPMTQYACYAGMPEFVNYFQTTDGLAASTTITYDESQGRGVINPRHECNNVLPGGAPFSMAVELLAYFHGDARTLTQTAYTYGRGFADAHRRFAQAFRALPAVPGTVVTHADADIKVRTYPTSNGMYVGVAHKGMAGKTVTVTVPGQAGKTIRNLVTGATVSASNSGSDRVFSLAVGPMELNAFYVEELPTITSPGTANGTTGTAFSYQIVASNNPTSYGATGLPAGLTINTSTGLISGTAAAGVYNVTLSATNANGTSTMSLTITITAPTAALVHRYTFNTNFADSVGVVSGTLMGNAQIHSGALQLPGYVSGTSSYGNLPLGGLSGLSSATFEAWFTVNTETYFNPVFFAGTTGTTDGVLFVPNGGGNPSIPQSEFQAAGGMKRTVLGTHLNTGTKYYVAVVYDAAANQQVLYLGTSGSMQSITTGNMNGQNLAQVVKQKFYLGAWRATSYSLNGSIDEFRVYNGPLTASQVEASRVAGPTPSVIPPVVTSATTVTGTANRAFSYQITANNGPTSFNATGLPAGLSVNTSTGLISGTAATTGTSAVALSAINSSGTGTATLTMTMVAPPPTLVHQYTFNTNFNDSVGTSHGNLVGNATISSGALQLPGYVSGTSSYGNLPTTALDGMSSATFEAWFTMDADIFYNPVFFAGTTGTTDGVLFVPNGGSSPSIPQSEFKAANGTKRIVLGSHLNTGTKYYVAVVYDAATNQQVLYLGANGTIQQTVVGNMNGQDLTQLVKQKFYLGAWTATSYSLKGSIDEFRVYDGPLNATQIAASCAAGPSTQSAFTSYPEFQFAAFPAESPLIGPNDDFDQDGMCNLLEYAFGLNASEPGATAQGRITRTGSERYFEYEISPLPEDLVIREMVSSNPASEVWREAVPELDYTPVGSSIEVLPDGRLKVRKKIATLGAMAFWRLEVSLT